MDTAISFPRYDKYKDSGVEWLGEIPAHWPILRNKYLFQERVTKGYPAEPLLAATQTHGVVLKTEYESRTVEATKDLHLLKLVREGDFVISLRSFEGGIEFAHRQGIISPAYTILIPRSSREGRFYRYFLKSSEFIQSLRLFVTGIREGQNIDYTKLSRSFLPCPPKDECDRIANFLDQKTAEIDAAIVKKQRLIELLKEQKAILIDQAVTQGLDPNVPMRDSGVEWIGKVPGHWKNSKLKYFIDLLPGYAFKSDNYSLDNLDIPLLRGININPGRLNWDDNVYWPRERLKHFTKYLLKPGDFVLGMDRPWVSGGIRTAQVTISDIPCLLLQRVARIRPRRGLEVNYLGMLLQSKSFLSYFEPMLSGISVPHISPEQVGNFPLSIPPCNEQKMIVSYVDQQSREHDLLIDAESRVIQTLQEFRRSIISEAVTGKIKL